MIRLVENDMPHTFFFSVNNYFDVQTFVFEGQYALAHEIIKDYHFLIALELLFFAHHLIDNIVWTTKVLRAYVKY